MLHFLKVKFYRLQTSRKYLNLMKFIHILFYEKFKQNIKIPIFYDYKIHRIEIINKIITLKKFSKYLEIGCDQNELFNKVNAIYKIGVDPISGGTHRMTSDKFFINNKEKFDLIFIDGLHTYKQTRLDIINSLKHIQNNGFILLHDCFPFTYYDQAVPRAQRKWNGDVWKAITEFRTYKELNVSVGAFDNGIGLIYKSDNKDTLLLEVNNNDFNKLKYKDYYNNFYHYLNLLSYDDFFKKINEHQ
tara:strand:+ start:846 stop:1580 length:735 start_codon:yes stop_codon:yes gene_type:complete